MDVRKMIRKPEDAERAVPMVLSSSPGPSVAGARGARSQAGWPCLPVLPLFGGLSSRVQDGKNHGRTSSTVSRRLQPSWRTLQITGSGLNVNQRPTCTTSCVS